MDDVISIGLQSRTVFWEDLGLPPRSKITRAQDDELAVFWDSEIRIWLLENVKGDVNAHDAGVWFADPKDAMFFKLVWAGNIPLKG